MYVGYALIGLALVLLTTILLYQAYGYGVDRKGRVIQNGLVFLSSKPEGGDVYIDGELYKSQTNTRIGLPAGPHTVRIQREGYSTWHRAITVEGGSLERFDYPLLVPTKLVTSVTKQYAEAPSIVTQSADRRWLLVGLANSNSFEVYDLKSAKPVPKIVAVPDDILAAGNTTGWQEVRWADDNRHVVLRRSYQKDANSGNEYVLFDRDNPTQTKNLSQILGFTPTTLELRKGDYDQYFAFDQANGTVFTASLKKPTPQLYLEHVLGFAADEDTALYATTQDAPDGKAQIRLRQGDDPAYTVRTVPTGTPYLLDLAVYEDALYIAAGAQNEGKVYVYQDPLADLKRSPPAAPAPVQILKVPSPNHVAFSDNARFVMAENNDRFAVYDAETDRGYSYQVKTPLDMPDGHALWADSYHLNIVSGGKVRIFDFDGANAQTLMAAAPAYRRAYSPNSKAVYALTDQHTLSSTALLTAKDQ